MQDSATTIMRKLLTSNETGWVYISPAALRTLVESLQRGSDALLRIMFIVFLLNLRIYYPAQQQRTNIALVRM